MESYEGLIIRRNLKERLHIDPSCPERGDDSDDFKKIFKKYETFSLIIRVYNYGTTAGDELHYVTGTSGLLYCFNGRDEGKWFKYREVLSKEKTPSGWSIEGYNPMMLPDEYILKHMQRHDNFLAKLASN